MYVLCLTNKKKKKIMHNNVNNVAHNNRRYSWFAGEKWTAFAGIITFQMEKIPSKKKIKLHT